MSKLSSKKKRRTGPITSTQRDFGDVNLDNIIYTSRDEQLFQRHLEVAIELSRKSSAIQDSQETKKSDPVVQPLDQPSSPSGDGSSQETRKTDLATLNLPSSSSDELSQEKKKSNLSLNISEEMVLPATKDEKELKSNGLSQETKKSNLPGHSDLSTTSEEILLPSTKKRKSDEGFSQETKKSNLPGHSDLETTSEEIFLPPTKKRKSDGAQGDLIKKKNLPKKSIRILDSDDDDSSFDDFQDDDSDEDFVMSKKPVPPAKKEKKNKLARSKKNDQVDEKKKKKDSKSQEDSPIRPKSKSRKLLKIESEDEDDDIIPDLDEDQPKAVVSKKDDSLKITVKADSSNSWKIMPEKKSSPVKRETRIKKPAKKIESEEDDDDDFNMEKDGENVKPKQMANIINKPKKEQKESSPKKSSNLLKPTKKMAAATTPTTSVNKIVKTTPKVSTAAKPKDTTSVTPSPQPSPSSALGVRTRPIFQMPKWNPPAMIGKGSGNKSSPSSSFSALKISSNSPGIRVGLSRLVTQFLIWFVVFGNS